MDEIKKELKNGYHEDEVDGRNINESTIIEKLTLSNIMDSEFAKQIITLIPDMINAKSKGEFHFTDYFD